MFQRSSWFCHSTNLHLITSRRCLLISVFYNRPVDYWDERNRLLNRRWLKLMWLIGCWILFKSSNFLFKLLSVIAGCLKHRLCLLKLLLKQSWLLNMFLLKLLHKLIMFSLQFLYLLSWSFLFIHLDCLYLCLDVILVLRLESCVLLVWF